EELIGELADRGTTVFMTTHDISGVERIADRVAVLRQGKLVLDEEMEALKRRFRRVSFPRTQEAGSRQLEALAPVAVAARGWAVEAVVSNYDEERFSASWPAGAPDHGEPEVTALTLEEIFIALTGEEEDR